MRPTKVKIFTTREVGGVDTDLVVECNYTPGCKGAGPLSLYGPTPDDPPEVEVVSVHKDAGSGKKGEELPDMVDVLDKDERFFDEVVCKVEEEYDYEGPEDDR